MKPVVVGEIRVESIRLKKRFGRFQAFFLAILKQNVTFLLSAQ